MPKSNRKPISLQKTLSYLLLVTALVPAMIISQYFIERQTEFMQKSEEDKLNNTISNIVSTIDVEVDKLVNILVWFSRDRSVLRGADNILYSAVIWERLEAMSQFSEVISAIYVIDKDGEVIYSHGGSAYHFEKSELYKKLDQGQSAFKAGKIYHTIFNEVDLVDHGGSRGVALFSPLLAYTLLEHSQYEPQGTIVALVDYQASAKSLDTVLYDDERVDMVHDVEVAYGHESRDGLPVTDMVIEHDNLASPIKLHLYYHFSDKARKAEIQETRSDTIRILIGILLLVVLTVLFLNRWVSRQFMGVADIVKSYSQERQPLPHTHKFRSQEFLNVSHLLDSMWKKINNHVVELKNKNDQLTTANALVEATNERLASFNQQLEQQVASKTSQLTDSLHREEIHQGKLVEVIHCSSQLKDAGYRGLIAVVDQHLDSLLPNLNCRFSYANPGHDTDPESMMIIASSGGATLAYIEFDVSQHDKESAVLIELYGKQLGYWLELLSFTRSDSLACAGNRQAFEEDFHYMQASLDSNRFACFSLLVLDINGLKAINDTHGHELGDKLITECADLINNELVGNQYLYRIGGDEFVILCEDMNSIAGLEMLDQLDIAQNNVQIVDDKGQQHVLHYSIGVASSDQCSAFEMFKVADRHMYQSKKAYYRQ
ncbi:GGDEF domain-containing protein [Vibrio tapetis subsp. quintayensis]|uniref:GGDEF domain-containing protein n=1 Tax=Vibrio tapetis TaxID=52443 RepID=UPI0025B56AAB|nr:GGDEF domain-containing protein [Vibrio tapetis]MDN3680856.1 GGDEF domain-containing protein [Vibrio tapetis subsp. quintayensis]